MQKLTQIISLVSCLSLMGGCYFCPTFKPDVTQGNIIKVEAVDQLRLGMTSQQVITLMGGHPVLENSFSQNRLHYVYIFERSGKILVKKRVVLYFDQGRLAKIDRDIPMKTDIYPPY
ncbi:hypothetical protein BH10PSE19_BH10PSE19_06170 [soil metagenome]